MVNPSIPAYPTANSVRPQPPQIAHPVKNPVSLNATPLRPQEQQMRSAVVPVLPTPQSNPPPRVVEQAGNPPRVVEQAALHPSPSQTRTHWKGINDQMVPLLRRLYTKERGNQYISAITSLTAHCWQRTLVIVCLRIHTVNTQRTKLALIVDNMVLYKFVLVSLYLILLDI